MSDIPDPVSPDQTVEVTDWLKKIEAALANAKHTGFYTKILPQENEKVVIAALRENISFEAMLDIDRLCKEVRAWMAIAVDLRENKGNVWIGTPERGEVHTKLLPIPFFSRAEAERWMLECSREPVHAFVTFHVVEMTAHREFVDEFRVYRGHVITDEGGAFDVRCSRCRGTGFFDLDYNNEPLACSRCNRRGWEPNFRVGMRVSTTRHLALVEVGTHCTITEVHNNTELAVVLRHLPNPQTITVRFQQIEPVEQSS